jgi:hypothetical protein
MRAREKIEALKAAESEEMRLVQFKMPDSELHVFACLCKAITAHRAHVIRWVISDMVGGWRRRLGPTGWQKLLDGQLTYDDLREIHQRSNMPRPELLVVGEQPLLPFDSDAA